MSKTPKIDAPPAPAALIHAATLREQRWAYERRRDRLSWGQIADLAMRPVAEGGLGYVRSPRALKEAYRLHAAEVLELEEATRPEHLQHMLEQLDASVIELRVMAGAVDVARTELARRAAEAEGATADELEGVIVLRPEADRRDAIKALVAVERDRAKLLGLDAPIHVEVSHRDATLEDLAAARQRLGLVTPIDRKKRAHA